MCQIRAIRLKALERGYLEELFVDEGKSVTKGQPMFQIMSRIQQAELDRAKAEADAAGIEHENTRLLHEKQVVSKNELALAKAKLDKATAEVTLCQAHRQLTAIAAPFDGIMGLLHVRAGSLLDEGELLTTLSDNRTMWVYFKRWAAAGSRPNGGRGAGRPRSRARTRPAGAASARPCPRPRTGPGRGRARGRRAGRR